MTIWMKSHRILLVICLVLIQGGFFQSEKLPTQISFILVGVWWIGFAQYTYAYLPMGTRKDSSNVDNIFTKGFKELKKIWNQLGENLQMKRYLYIPWKIHEHWSYPADQDAPYLANRSCKKPAIPKNQPTPANRSTNWSINDQNFSQHGHSTIGQIPFTHLLLLALYFQFIIAP